MMNKSTLLILFLFLYNTAYTQNPELVIDLNPGTERGFGESGVSIKYNGKSYFSANNGTTGFELFSLDNNTVSLVKDINTGSEDSNPKDFFLYNGTLYFVASDNSGNTGLWKSDGTSEGTVPAIPLNGKPSGMTITASNQLYFSYANNVYISDGTAAGTEELTVPSSSNVDFNFLPGERNYTSYGDGIAFMEAQGDSLKIWYAQNENVIRLGAVSISSLFFYSDLIEVQEGLVFTIRTGLAPSASGHYLYNRNTQSIEKLDDSKTSLVAPFEDGSCFRVTEGGYDIHNGKPSETKVLLNALYEGSGYNYFAIRNGSVFFLSGGAIFEDTVLHFWDGSDSQPIAKAVSERGYLSRFFQYGEFLFFATNTSNGFSPVLWVANFDNGDSEILYEFTENSPINSIIPFAVQDGKLYFLSALDGTVGRELYSLNLDFTSSITSSKVDASYEIVQVDNQFQIKAGALEEDLNINLIDHLGRLIQSKNVSSEKLFSLSVPNTGIYFIHVSGEKGQVVAKRFIK